MVRLFWIPLVIATALSVSCGPSSGTAPGQPAMVHFKVDLASPLAPAHAQFLKDPLEFVALPDGDVSESRTAVVGSRVARFYPASVETLLRRVAKTKINSEDIPRDPNTYGPASDYTQSGLDKLPEGSPLPFGTILPLLLGKEESNEEEGLGYSGIINGPIYRYFAFEGNFNRFYRTRFQGQEGYVFGADLYGIDQKPLANQIASELYLTAGKPSSFHAVTGLRYLNSEATDRLKESRLAFQATVNHEDYYLSPEYPDDLVANYRSLVPNQGHNYQTVFLTTDLAAHAQHLVFDRILQFEEEHYFAPRLRELVEGLMTAVAQWSAAHPQVDPWVTTLASRYLQIGDAVLRLAPNVKSTEDESGREVVQYEEVERDSVTKELPPEVLADLEEMEKAGGFADSAILSHSKEDPYKEDFSQYRPRGHYTKNGVLKAYFKAMMWFGRIHFLIARAGNGDSTKLTLNMEPTALLFADLISRDPTLYKKWADLFDPITALIGLSDDLSFEEVVPLWKGENVSDFAAWASKKENVLAFMEKAHQKLRPPAISGNSVFMGPSEDADRKPPMGWRLFGQRFTWDSYVHEQVSPPRLLSRDMVRGLDVMRAFGSKTAESLLAVSDYPKMEGLQARLGEVSKIFAGWKEEDWAKTFYNQTLFTIRSQALFEPGVGFYFTESPAWGLKAMISSHGTWAELRHDTLLYVKQVYAERAGDGDFEPTFRIEEVPKPIHYIEPNLPFWQGVANASEGLSSVLARFDLLDDEGRTALNGLNALYSRAASIVEKEVADQEVSREDLDWIPNFAGELVPLVMVHNKLGSSIDEDQLKMALIADVYTNAEMGQVLEVGVGVPWRLYVPLNDSQGGKRIAVGYTFSYYEFAHPMGDRLTDEAWKAMVYPDGSKTEDKLPFWAQGLALTSDHP